MSLDTIRVLTLVPYKIFPARFGGQKNIALFFEHLAKACEVVCVTVKSNDPRYAKGYTLLNPLADVPLRYINPLYFFTLRRIIRQYRITHLMLEHPYYGWLGILLKLFTGVKLVIRSQNIESLRWKSLGKWWWKILWWYERATHRAAHDNFFITDNDREYAVKYFRLSPSKCTTVTYGVEIDRAPAAEERARCKKILQQRHGIEPGETIFLFNGALNYLPNSNAVQAIVQQVNPVLLREGLSYKIVICGKGLPEEMNGLKDYAHQNIIHAGFVEDIDTYFKGSDVFLNPVVEGGGIKTKLIEALSYNLNAVSSASGAYGVDTRLTNNKLLVTPDYDWPLFAQAAKQSAASRADIPAAYFGHFYWGHIIRRAVSFMQQN
ncbi:MAG: glycosyltransferase [Williamsia sp.]|nr:glycosyltransferase [Williamsia sp.]